MPNWCYNKVYMKDLANKNIFNEEGRFDFNKLIPMPEELEDAVGDDSADLAHYYVGRLFLNLDCYSFGWNAELREILAKKVNDVYERYIGKKYYTEIPTRDSEGKYFIINEEKLFEFGKEEFDRIVKYGAVSWYDWSCKNWGTKWNCNSEQYTSDYWMEFQTAWAPPTPVMLELSRQNPTSLITHYYIDEGYCFAGYSLYLNGQIIYEFDSGDPNSIDSIFNYYYIGYETGNPPYDWNNDCDITYKCFIQPAFSKI